MFAHSVEAPQLVVAAVLALLDAIALVVVWRSRRRGRATKAIWTAIIIVLPAVGVLGFVVHEGIGRLSCRIERSARR